MRKPRALASGDRIAIVAPGSPFARDAFDAGIAELRALGFEPVYDESIFARDTYLAGPAPMRAATWMRAWSDPSIAALVAARGGYGSIQILPFFDSQTVRQNPKVFIGYSDNTALLTWLTLACGIVSFHGPMIEGRFARGAAGYDRDTFERCVCRASPAGEITDPKLEALRQGETAGMLVGGTLTQLTASLGTPYAFEPPDGCVLFIEDVGERPYRIDRMLTQLTLAGVLRRASALVFGEMRECDEAGGQPKARGVIERFAADFHGPVLFGLPSGHTTGPMMTLPFGVRARVVAGSQPALIVEEAAVS